ncbi:MAG TPA: hypothetical protein VEK33_25650, partial [Terriglobales bacterium]|nr:hypothetical protein [Terriglobales bacterium]
EMIPATRTNKKSAEVWTLHIKVVLPLFLTAIIVPFDSEGTQIWVEHRYGPWPALSHSGLLWNSPETKSSDI